MTWNRVFGRIVGKHFVDKAMFSEGGETRENCFLAMFPEGRQTRKHVF
jgi:hypothetical protein